MNSKNHEPLTRFCVRLSNVENGVLCSENRPNAKPETLYASFSNNISMKEKIIFGAVLIPEKLIYRQPNLKIPEEYYIKFSAETIRAIWVNFHKKNREKNISINHNGENISGVELVDSFLIDKDNRDSLSVEFKDLPIGTWMVKYKIMNEDVWRMIERKEVNGFSIEGIFDLVKIKE